jgi:iron complex transport system ATP-binding protein
VTARILEARGLRHAFGARTVLDGVDLALHSGERLVVLGPNGAGKTTLVRVLCGVLRPDAGSATLKNWPVERLSRREIARVLAVVPQELSVPFPYTVREMVAMGRASRIGALGRESATDRQAIEQALAQLGLTELARRPFPTLSGGEKQRVILARALAQAADLMILDEPTSQMDLGHRIHTFAWLGDWVAEKPNARGALIVTHDLWLAARFADRMILLHGGRVAAEGAPAAVLTPALIDRIYGVEATVTTDPEGRPLIVAGRSRIGYIERSGESNRETPSARDP